MGTLNWVTSSSLSLQPTVLAFLDSEGGNCVLKKNIFNFHQLNRRFLAGFYSVCFKNGQTTLDQHYVSLMTGQTMELSNITKTSQNHLWFQFQYGSSFGWSIHTFILKQTD